MLCADKSLQDFYGVGWRKTNRLATGGMVGVDRPSWGHRCAHGRLNQFAADISLEMPSVLLSALTRSEAVTATNGGTR